MNARLTVLRMSGGFPPLFGFLLLLLTSRLGFATTEDLGRGFRHHGVAVPISNHRGTVATVDGQGRNVVLSWLNDHRGGYELLLIDVEAGRAEEYPMPFPPGDHPFASILSRSNKFYTHFNGHFVEFDPAKRAFTFSRKTAPQMAMSMTEDDRGVIWSATYPNCGLVSFNPATRECKDYGYLNKESWVQYPRALAADAAGWIYIGIGSTRGQVIAFNAPTAKVTPLVPESQRVHGYPQVIRDLDGNVYAQPQADQANKWLALRDGKATPISIPVKIRPKVYVTGSQGLFHDRFPDGKRIKTYNLAEREFAIEDPKSKMAKAFRFDYRSEGAHIMGVAAAPDGTICGGTAFPMRFFSYNPRTDAWAHHDTYGQCNTVERQGDRFFVGGYGHGFLLEWNPARAWVPTAEGRKDSNPLFLTQCHPTINRPHKLLAHPDGKTVVLAGTPGYGFTGGGLLFWDRETRARVLLEHTSILPQHSTMSLVALPNGKLLGGSTTSAGTGGERKAKEAELYVMDMATKQLDWHAAVLPGAQNYTDLCVGPAGLVFGFADQRRFFVFDPANRKLVHQEDTTAQFGATTSHQGPRVFVRGPGNTIYILFVKGIARLDTATFKISMEAESPVRIGFGGDYLDGRIYFGNGSHLYSYRVANQRGRAAGAD